MRLTDEQRTRYARNLRVPGIGEAGQERLLRARVLVAGLGGLGSPVSLYLAAAGIGTLGLLDSDVLELSNLQRQILHTTARLGHAKTLSARESLAALNPGTELRLHPVRLTGANAAELFASYDAIVEASDNFETKYLINDVCMELAKPFASAGILSLSGQAIFVVPGQSPCLRCAVPEAPRGIPTTAELGVLGAVPGILGSVEALEVIRWVAGLWRPQADQRGLLHTVDGETMRLHTMRLPRRPDCPCASLWSTT